VTSRSKYCAWFRADDDTDMWESACGNAFQFNDDGPVENKFAFCPYCGARVDAEPVRLSSAMRRGGMPRAVLR
jgi:rRNA maturation endonuclease Nob1